MKRAGARLLAAFIALGFSAAAAAQGYLGRLLDDFNEVKALSQRKQRFEYENDVFFKTDKNYTDGVRYGYKYLGLRQYRKPPDAEEGFLPGFNLDPVSSAACADGKLCYHKSYTFYLGHSMYTPSDIKLASDQIPPGDRPYAAWLYFGFYRELFASDGRYWRYGLDLGCVGPARRASNCRLSSTAISPDPRFRRAGQRRYTMNPAWCFAMSTCPAHGNLCLTSI
ncbi:MAG: lipid A-modifier LpxR family protein [Pseudomonadota bacterium]